MLVEIEDVLSESQLGEIRHLLKQADWVSGVATAGTQAAQVKNNQQIKEGSAVLQTLRQHVLSALNQNALFFTAALPLKILPPFFNRYSGSSNAYGFHVDNAMRLQPDGSGYVRADVSATLFLSDPDEYDGGVLTVEDTYGKHEVKLKAGSMVVYPSSSLHAVSPVTRGERLACFMFMQSMVRSPEQRTLLFNMDMALLQLRQSQGETPPVVQLTSVYHNLLRQWADS